MTREPQSGVDLRPLGPGDFDAWHRSLVLRVRSAGADDGRSVAPEPPTVDRYRAVLARYAALAEADTAHVLGVFGRSAGELVGLVDLTTLARDDRDWANLGFEIYEPFRRRGYARAAIAAAVHHGFTALGYHRIEAAIRLDNAAAMRAVASAGMEREGVRRRFWRDDDGWTDHVIYVAIAD